MNSTTAVIRSPERARRARRTGLTVEGTPLLGVFELSRGHLTNMEKVIPLLRREGTNDVRVLHGGTVASTLKESA